MLETIHTNAQWIWAADAAPQQAFVAISKTVNVKEMGSASIRLFADTFYKLYINGRFVNAGPAPFRKPVIMLDSYDLSSYMQTGENHICILCHFVGKTIKWNTTDAPGCIAELRIANEIIPSDETWSATPITAWQADVPEMGWALGGIECIDAKDPSYAVLQYFAGEDYGAYVGAAAPATKQAIRVAQNITDIRARMVPPLRWQRITCRKEPIIWRVSREVFNLNDHAARTVFEHREPVLDAEAVHIFQDDGVHLDRRVGERGFGLHYDFRRICAGDFSFTIHCESAATISIGFTERVMDGIPECTRMSKFMMRFHAQPGRNVFRMYKFSGFRHLFVTLKDFEGHLHVEPPTCHECFAAIDYQDKFVSSDRFLDNLYDISRRSIILNTQAQSYDCNSREQGCYWGDSIFILDMAGHMSGDFSHMRHLCYAMVDEYQALGKLNSSLFGMGRVLFDYCLVPMEMMRRYYDYTGDEQCIRDCMQTAQAIIADFKRLKHDNGLIALSGWQDDDEQRMNDGLLFLDHPGLGWHPRDSVGINRDDYNAGIQLFYLQAMQALDALQERLGLDRPYGDEIAAHQSLIMQKFYNQQKGLVADVVDVDGQHHGYSQLVNALAVHTGTLDAAQSQTALRLICDIDQQAWIAHGTPYGYFYLIDALRRFQDAETAIRLVKQLFAPMLQRGATCTWETFGGEIHDSLNHAWSAVWVYAVQRLLLGLEYDAQGARLHIQPQCLDRVQTQLHLPQGLCQINWQSTSAEDIHCSLTLSGDQALRVRCADVDYELHQTLEIEQQRVNRMQPA